MNILLCLCLLTLLALATNASVVTSDFNQTTTIGAGLRLTLTDEIGRLLCAPQVDGRRGVVGFVSEHGYGSLDLLEFQTLEPFTPISDLTSLRFTAWPSTYTPTTSCALGRSLPLSTTLFVWLSFSGGYVLAKFSVQPFNTLVVLPITLGALVDTSALSCGTLVVPSVHVSSLVAASINQYDIMVTTTGVRTLYALPNGFIGPDVGAILVVVDLSTNTLLQPLYTTQCVLLSGTLASQPGGTTCTSVVALPDGAFVYACSGFPNQPSSSNVTLSRTLSAPFIGSYSARPVGRALVRRSSTFFLGQTTQPNLFGQTPQQLCVNAMQNSVAFMFSLLANPTASTYTQSVIQMLFYEDGVTHRELWSYPLPLAETALSYGGACAWNAAGDALYQTIYNSQRLQITTGNLVRLVMQAGSNPRSTSTPLFYALDTPAASGISGLDGSNGQKINGQKPNGFVPLTAALFGDTVPASEAAPASLLPLATLAKRIVNGFAASISDAPHACQLSTLGGYYCGCVILGASIIATSAHCVVPGDVILNGVVAPYRVTACTTAFFMGGQTVTASRSSTHPSWLAFGSTPDQADVAVVYLDTPLTLTPGLCEPIRIGSPASVDVGSPVDFYGWGYDQAGHHTASLRTFGAMVSEREILGYALGSLRKFSATPTLPQQNVWYGDSGSGIVATSSTGVHTLVGITSFLVDILDPFSTINFNEDVTVAGVSTWLADRLAVPPSTWTTYPFTTTPPDAHVGRLLCFYNGCVESYVFTKVTIAASLNLALTLNVIYTACPDFDESSVSASSLLAAAAAAPATCNCTASSLDELLTMGRDGCVDCETRVRELTQ